MPQSKKYTTRSQQKRDIEANWKLAVNFVPLAGEIIVYEVDETHSAPRIKIGDGKTLVNDLPFSGGDIPLVVEVDDDGYATHTPAQMFEHVLNGGNVYFQGQGLSYIDESVAFFDYIGDDAIIGVCVIDENRGCEWYDYSIVTNENFPSYIADYNLQPDWNQNDETALDYVKNRTHYVKPQVDITWDGNMEGRHTIRVYDNCYDVKVSDEAYPIELFNGGALEIRSYKDHSIDSSGKDFDITFFDVYDGAFSLDLAYGADFTVVTDANAYNQSFGDDLNRAKYENGIYFRACLGEVYTSKLTIPENIIQIDEKYIPRIKPLVVTRKDRNTVSHTPKEMYEHIQKGGSVYFGSHILTFIDCPEDTPGNAIAEFSYYDGEDVRLCTYRIDASGYWEYFEFLPTSEYRVEKIIKSYGIDKDTEREETIINNTLRADSGLILGDDIRMSSMGITQLLVYEDDDTSAVNKGYVDNQFLQLGLYTSEHENYGTRTVIDNPLLMNNAIDMNHDFIYNVMSPINDNDAANKAYVDAPKSHIVLTDSVTNINYKLSITDGKLTMEVVE